MEIFECFLCEVLGVVECVVEGTVSLPGVWFPYKIPVCSACYEDKCGSDPEICTIVVGDEIIRLTIEAITEG